MEQVVRTGAVPRRMATIGAREDQAGRAGFLAALTMLAVQLIWRLEWSQGGTVHAFPEFIVAAISRLIPLSVFAAGTENYGSLAKNSLFVGVLVGIAAVGYGAGVIAGRLSRRWGPGLARRLAAGGVVTAAIVLFTGLVVLPISHDGVFASGSDHTSAILLRLFVTFAIFALTWALLAAPLPAPAATTASDEAVSRRAVIQRAVWSGGTLAALVAVGGSTWRLLSPAKSTVNAAQSLSARDRIVATQRALRSQPTPTPVAQAAVNEVASLGTDIAPVDAVAAAEDATALFDQLDKAKQLTPVLTATSDFYHVSKNITDPDVDKGDWKLKVTGMVNKEIELSYDDLFNRAKAQNITTLCCISNQINGDLISTTQWTGLPLKDLLAQAGVKPGVVKAKFHCADDYEDSIALDRAMDPDTYIVVAMNGEPLPRDHGFPARMIVPGIYGMKNVKWLERIELTDEDFKGYWQTRGWSDPAPNQVWGRIDYPRSGESIKPGATVAAGVASAGDRDIKRVEISLDDGKTWADATLEPSLNPPFTWVRWAYPFDAKAGKFTMRLRATDGTGKVMDQEERDPLPDGPTGYPERRVEVKD